MPAKAGKRRTTASHKAGLQFPVMRCKRLLKDRLGRRQRMSNGAPVYMAAVMEYLAAEILEISGNVARDHKLKRITPRHVMLAIKNDEELKDLCKDVTIPSSGVMPNIHAILVPKKFLHSPSLKPAPVTAGPVVAAVKKLPIKKVAAPSRKAAPVKKAASPKKGRKPAASSTPKRKSGGITVLSERVLSGGQKVTVLSGDIVDVDCDCIVTSDGGQVNSRLTWIGGNAFQQKIKEAGADWTKTVGICEAANFASNHVMRVSAPTWGGAGSPLNAVVQLDKTIKSCLETADKHGINSISFPSIGSGGAGFPKQTAVQTILRTISDYFRNLGKKTQVNQVYFVLFDQQSINIYTSELGRFVE